jgi:hypothetical protein
MVARITTPGSLQKALNYNEQKVQKGVAECIAENGFLLPLSQMNFYDKREGFERRNSLNERASTKMLHVSLNFSSGDDLDYGKMIDISRDYMNRMGFLDQPWLVYHHDDAGHPHVHIIASLIRADGTRIPTHNLGRNQSELARKIIEEKYGLVRAEDQLRKCVKILPVDPVVVQYGRIETRRGIAAVLNAVLNTYNFISMPQLNAVLKQYNVMADSGEPGSYLNEKKGLYYRVLGSDGLPVGVPVKASSFGNSPTLARLETTFLRNKTSREKLSHILKAKIDAVLTQPLAGLKELEKSLLDRNIVIVKRINEDGKLYGITFVDNQQRCVFNGSELGKGYSAAGILKQISPDKAAGKASQHRLVEFNGLSVADALMRPEDELTVTPWQLKKRKRKKKNW